MIEKGSLGRRRTSRGFLGILRGFLGSYGVIGRVKPKKVLLFAIGVSRVDSLLFNSDLDKLFLLFKSLLFNLFLFISSL